MVESIDRLRKGSMIVKASKVGGVGRKSERRLCENETELNFRAHIFE